MIRAAILGASGYVGGELMRLIAHHPAIEVGVAFDDSTIKLKGDLLVGGGSGIGVEMDGEETTLKIAKSSEVDANVGILSGSVNGFVKNAGNIAGGQYGAVLDTPTELASVTLSRSMAASLMPLISPPRPMR